MRNVNQNVFMCTEVGMLKHLNTVAFTYLKSREVIIEIKIEIKSSIHAISDLKTNK